MGRIAVVAGASGLVGGRLVAQLAAHPDVERVVCLVRRTLGTHGGDAASKIEERIVDFRVEHGRARTVDDAMPRADDAYCCLGTTMKQAGSKDAFLAVDKHAVLAFARAARDKGARRFVLVSSLGADARSMNFYLRTKGEVEEELKTIGFDALYCLRPSILDGDRQEQRVGERLGLVVMRGAAAVLGKRWRYAPTHVDDVARTMIRCALSDQRGAVVVEAPQISSWAS